MPSDCKRVGWAQFGAGVVGLLNWCALKGETCFVGEDRKERAREKGEKKNFSHETQWSLVMNALKVAVEKKRPIEDENR